MPIRKGDGTSVVPNGIQEVRLGDGTVLWTSSDSSDPAPEPNGPSGEWNLTVQDEFDQGSLDTDLWGVNAGEFIDPFDDDGTNAADHVTVENDSLTLEVSSDGSGAGGCYQGAISSYPGDQSYHADTGFKTGNVPGVYFEVRAQLAGPRNGLLPAFWTNAVGSEAWPPEIDIYELFQTSSPPDPNVTAHSGHWTTTEVPGDQDNHIGMGYHHDHGADTTAAMHTYGAAWFRDRIEFWIDGVHEGTLNLLPMLNLMNSPDRNDLYMKFTTHVNRVGSADLTTAWSEENVVDYVRVWEWDGAPQSAPTPPSFSIIDTFDGSLIADGWNDPNGAWTQTTTYASSGNYSITNTANNEPIGWEGSPSFGPGATGTRLQFDFAFGGDTSNRLNTRFGSTGATDGESYRLDILDGEIFLFETSSWNALHHDQDFAAGAAGEFFSVELEYTEHNLRYEIRDATDTIVSTHARYHTEGFDGPAFSFSAENGTAYVDNVRLATDETSIETQLENEFHIATNDHRSSQGLSDYSYRDDLAAVARAHSHNMYEQDSLNHSLDGKDMSDRVADAGITYSSLAENIAYQSTDSIDGSQEQLESIAQSFLDSWLSSTSGHRENIESSMDSEGIGVYIDDANNVVWATAMFITP